MEFSLEQIREALMEMATKALAFGMDNGEVIIGFEFPHESPRQPYQEFSLLVGNINRESKNGDPGRNYDGTAHMKLAFSRRTKHDSGTPGDVVMLGEIEFPGCIVRPHKNGWVYFCCSGLALAEDDVRVAEEGFATLILH